MEPEVSVVVATYHRPRVLRYALQSALRQTVRDIEVIVVGDATTDDTADVVAAIAKGDDRVRFINLTHNVGDQSGPNNHGVSVARGRHVAFLNHDDLWWPDHLERGLQTLRESRADLCFAQLLCLSYGTNLILGAVDAFDPTALIPASSWLMTAQTATDVGPWRRANEVYSFPSQEWLFRAWYAGEDRRFGPLAIGSHRRHRKHIVPTGHISVVHLPSGRVKDSYLHDDDREHARYTELILAGGPRAVQVSTPPRPRLRRELRLSAQRLLAHVGVQPMAIDSALRYRGRRGKEIERLRLFRGLRPSPPEEPA